MPAADIERALRPSEAQRPKLDALQKATAKAAEIVKAACPREIPGTPPGRLAAVEKRLQAMQQAVRTVRPAVEALYTALDDEQKARFNALGQGERKRQRG
jgi:hypothetical protein